MDYIKKEKKNYNLYIMKTNDFKVVNISFVFQRKNSMEDELYRTLLKRILFLKTAKYDSLEKLSSAGAEIYNPKVFVKTQTSSIYRTFNLRAEFINEKYTEDGMNKSNIEFIMDYFWHPFIKDGAFDKETFDLCKKNYIEELKSAKNYPEEYALDECWRSLNLYEFKLPTNEELIKILEEIDEKKLYSYYKSMFTEDSLDIFIVGDVTDDMETVIDDYIYGDFQKSVMLKPHEYTVSKVNKIKEKTDNPQSKLFLGYKMNNLTTYENEYVSLIFAMILGGGTESYLHSEARKKRSLCYYIYASCYNLFNVMIVSAGISAKNSKEVIKITEAEINRIKNGDVDDDKLTEVKQLYKNILLESKDSQMSLINNLVARVTKEADDIETRFKMVDKMSVDDIITLAGKVKLDTIFLLEGTE